MPPDATRRPRHIKEDSEQIEHMLRDHRSAEPDQEQQRKEKTAKKPPWAPPLLLED